MTRAARSSRVVSDGERLVSRMRDENNNSAAQVALATSRAEAFDYVGARRALMTWFDAHGRVFPWRSDPTPYRVWISEIMLQQTTTQTVLGYFERFLARFPDPSALAAAREEEVLALWEGLGYYRRARGLHAAAKVMTERFGGRVPDAHEDVLALPGVGKYCAGAILSFGFDKRFPILEANTTRLHARLLALDVEPTGSAAQKVLWRAAEEWLPCESRRRPENIYRRINGALTDLGRLVCQPGAPKCGECPLAKFCAAYKSGMQNDLPVLPKKEAPIPRADVAFWISRADLAASTVPSAKPERKDPTDVLLIRYPSYALWAGLWDFPRLEIADPAYRDHEAWRRDPELADRLALFLESEAGAPAERYWPGPALKTFRHSVTRYRITLNLARLENASDCVSAQSPESRLLFDVLPPSSPASASDPDRLAPSAPTKRLAGKPLAAELRWVPLADLPEYPLSSTGRKIVRFIMDLCEIE